MVEMIDVIQKLREIANRSPEEIGRAIAAAEKLSGRPVAEEKKAKPDFLDVDKDGNKKESFKKALKDKEEKEETKESVSEDVQITLSGSDAVLAEILKLAGQIGAKTTQGPEPVVSPAAPVAAPTDAMPMGVPSSGPLPSLDKIVGGDMHDEMPITDTMMDDAYDASTTPNTFTMGDAAAVPSGNDLARSKITAPKVSSGDNPLHTSISFD